ncbi:MAG TPA: hypothetical protein VFA27_18075 [Vicinamibacterales bacterium]|nr:hypothetical protein [Vicinamibacterales bacterium]
MTATTILVAVAACSPTRRPALTPGPSPARLAAADAELRAGCLDCLIAAYEQYTSLRGTPGAEPAATAGAIRAAVLVALRERELGMIDDGYGAKARELITANEQVSPALAALPDIADTLPASRGGIGHAVSTDAALERLRALRQHRDAWLALLRNAAHDEVAAAYVWVAVACDAVDAPMLAPTEIFDVASAFAGAPLVVYREALCRRTDVPTLESILAADPRFVETAYSIGFAALAARPPQLDEADQWFRRAYAWRPKWPSLTLAMGGVALSGEEFERARGLYEETLALEPHSGDAMFGDLRALTYAGAPQEAIAMADRMIADRWSVGDARYWRAFNELQLSRLDEAWQDVEDAARTLIDAQVPKLAGLIAYRRQQLDVAIARFTTSFERNPLDCETRFYLGVVHADRQHWPQTADALAGAAECFQNAEIGLTEEIARIRASTLADDRKARQIARREQQVADGRRRIAASWFDIAVADYSLSKRDEARAFAEKVSGDEQFGERARALLARMR